MRAVVLCIHSTGTSPGLWSALPPKVLALGARVAPANLGYEPGAPLARGVQVTAKDEAAHLLRALPAEAEEVHLVAHSYGGLAALELLPLLGARARSLFLYEPVLFGALVNEPEADPAALAEAAYFSSQRWFVDDDARGGSEAWLEIFIDYWNRPGAWARMPPALQEETRRVGWKMFQEVRACFYGMRSFDDYALSVPTTLAMGERSPKASRAMVKALGARNPGARVVELAKVGHMAPLTHPQVVAEALAAHADGLRLR